ncbi:InlB B-repeat-containing protein [Roseburia hominis]|uniref:InlB B-repeat-containing protein n=1 Tax=Roseburia hominis TaxID=301301 RepID=UPI002665A8C9|nr:InlB B-repeat-containing protein [Roseburia hominis]
MYYERKLRDKRKIIWLLGLGLLFMMITLMHTDKIMAATSSGYAANGVQKNVTEYVPTGQNGENTTVGRYALNYTGNINVYSSPSLGNDDVSYCCQTLPGWPNSSMGTLYGDNNTTKVVKAYLIWETRKRYNQYDEKANHVRFIMRDGNGMNIYPDRVYVDDRSSQYVSGWEQSRPRIYCNVADVTNIVRSYGYGDYYVANIPVCRASDLWEQDTGGGGTPTGWQLIVVEENEDYPVRAVTLKAGSVYRFGNADWEGNTYGSTDAERATVTMGTELFNGLKTKEYGDVTGQVLFGSINASTSGNGMGVNLYTQQQIGAAKSLRSAGDTPREGGFYRGSDYFAQGHDLCSVLYEVSGLEQGASVFGVDITRVSWNTQLYIGAAVDIAFPEFESQQTTSISDGKVIVKGTIENTSVQDNTGIYDGVLTVTLDPNLTPDLSNYSIAVNGNAVSGVAVRQGTVTDADGTVHNTVTFSGGGISSCFGGDKIEYTIYCQISGSGMSRFDNRDQLDGYLRSAGVDTGHWIDKACTASSWCNALFRVELIAGNGIQSVSGAGDYTPGVSVAINAVVKNGYHWTGWTGTYETDTKQYIFVMPAQNVSMTANAQINHSTLKVDPNGGSWQGSATVQSFTEHYGTAKSIPDPVRTGYTFSGWVKSEPFNGSLNNAVYTFGTADRAVDVLTASWTANSYKLHFDPNDGREATPIDDMTITYDQEVVLPDATGQYIRYTLDGEDITLQVLDGTIVLDDAGRVVMMMDADTGLMMTPAGGVVNEDGSITNPDGSITNPDGSVADPEAAEMETSGQSTEALEEEATEAEASGKAVEEPKEETTEAEASSESMEVLEASGAEEDVDVQVAEAEEAEAPEEPEDPTADPVPDKKAYASVFMGWSLEDGRESFIPQWTAGTSIAVADLTNAAGVTDQSGAIITLYAVWDDCPWIVAENLYYTLTQAQSGYITDSEILSHATAYDREDGSPIEPGFHENGTSFSIPDYQASDFTQFRREGSCTENLTVVDSTGSTYCKQITVYVVDTTAVAVEPEGTTRFINEYYYNQPEANGGLAADSIWLTDPEYAAALQTAFANSRNGSAEEVYEFSHEDILAMKQFIDDNGFGNTRSDDALTRFYNQFMAPNKVE